LVFSVIRLSVVMIIGGWAIEVLDGIIRLKTEEIIMKAVYCDDLNLVTMSPW
jgi:hypothetical protein